MATLQKIRNRSVLLVSIIFVALFLFIITIIDNPLGLFMDQTSVANVNGQKIDYEQYNERANLIREQNPQVTDADEQALRSLVTETLYKQEFDKLGLAVTDKELSSYLTAEDAPYSVVAQFYQQFGATPADVLTALKDPAASGLNQEQINQISRSYAEFEKNLTDQLLTQKLFGLLQGTINANKLDAKQIFDEGNTTYTLAAVSKNLYETTDTVTPAEIEKYYNSHREAYKLSNPARFVRYVTLPVSASAQDRQKAMTAAQEALAAVQAGEKMDALIGNGAFVIDHQIADSTAVKNVTTTGLRDFLKNAEVGTAEIVGPNSAYAPNDPKITIARLISRENKPNSAMISQVVFDGTVGADSIVAQLNAGVKADSISGVAQAMPAQKMTFEQLTNVIDTLKAVGPGKYINLGQAAIAVESFGAPEQVVEYYTATYAVEPSRETIDQLNTRMRDFLISAPNAETFTNDNAMLQGLMVQETLIDESNASLDGMEDSRNMVAWAMDAKKGQVSRLYTDSKNSRLAAIAVVDEYKDYIPYTFPGLSAAIKQGAQTEKNADIIIKEVGGKGNSLDEYKNLMGVQRVDTMRGVNLSGGRYGQLGAVRAAKPGQIVGPVRWNSAVIVYSVIDSQEGSMPYDEKSTSMQFQRQARNFVLGQNPDALLLGDGRIRYKFLRFTRQ